MKTTHYSYTIKAAILAAALSTSANLRAVTSGTLPLADNSRVGEIQLQTVTFSDSAEAGMLRRAYRILATGDHDYKGHRVKAMHAVEAAAKLLGVSLRGDGERHEKQVLSDERLREAQGLITQVLGAAEVKNEVRVTRHLDMALKHLNLALAIR
jgi:hypothetical protein